VTAKRTTRARIAAEVAAEAQGHPQAPARQHAYRVNLEAGPPLPVGQQQTQEPPATRTRPAGPHDYKTSPGGPPVPAERVAELPAAMTATNASS
jgi:hypothetical protein